MKAKEFAKLQVPLVKSARHLENICNLIFTEGIKAVVESKQPADGMIFKISSKQGRITVKRTFDELIAPDKTETFVHNVTVLPFPEGGLTEEQWVILQVRLEDWAWELGYKYVLLDKGYRIENGWLYFGLVW